MGRRCPPELRGCALTARFFSHDVLIGGRQAQLAPLFRQQHLGSAAYCRACLRKVLRTRRGQTRLVRIVPRKDCAKDEWPPCARVGRLVHAMACGELPWGADARQSCADGRLRHGFFSRDVLIGGRLAQLAPPFRQQHLGSAAHCRACLRKDCRTRRGQTRRVRIVPRKDCAKNEWPPCARVGRLVHAMACGELPWGADARQSCADGRLRHSFLVATY